MTHFNSDSSKNFSKNQPLKSLKPLGIPTSWYSDPKICELEKKIIFSKFSINYVGHELMVPELNDYFVLPNGIEILSHNKNGIEIVSNICRHHQAVMLEGRGNSSKLICPIHQWCYGNDGSLLRAPNFHLHDFESLGGKACLNLPIKKLQNWKGLLFSGDFNLDQMFAGGKTDKSKSAACLEALDFKNYAYSNTTSVQYEFNWKVFIDNYLDDYHVQSFHPGLRSVVDCNEISWEFSEHYSIQGVGVQKKRIKGSIAYQNWYDALVKNFNYFSSQFGAVWFLLYPNIMIEHYPEMLTISVVTPIGPEKCVNTVSFFYPEEILKKHPEIVRLSQLAYQETAIEDQEICDRIFKGKKALAQNNINDIGPCHSPSEDGIPYFHDYLLKKLKN